MSKPQAGIPPEMLAALATVRVQQYILICSRTVFLFYYFAHIDEEVFKIWRAGWTSGKILFLITTYSLLARVFVDAFANLPNGFTITPKICWNSTVAIQILNLLHTYGPTGSVLLCLHALLGAKRKYLIAVAIFFSGYVIFAMVLVSLWLVAVKATPAPYPVNKVSPCYYEQKRHQLNTILTYGNVLREGAVMCIGAIAVISRFRSQHNSLLKVIRRDGGLYLIAVFLLGLTAALLRTPGFPVYDKYSVIQELRIIAYPILANRLMLNLRESDDYDTRTAVSVIMFTPGPASSGDTDDEENSDDEDVPLTSMATGIQSRSAVARGTTAVDAV